MVCVAPVSMGNDQGYRKGVDFQVRNEAELAVVAIDGKGTLTGLDFSSAG